MRLGAAADNLVGGDMDINMANGIGGDGSPVEELLEAVRGRSG